MFEKARVIRAKEPVYANGGVVTVAGAGKAVRGSHPDVIVDDGALCEDITMAAHMRRKIRTVMAWHGRRHGPSRHGPDAAHCGAGHDAGDLDPAGGDPVSR